MKFCSHCSAPLTFKIPAGEDRERFVCERCGTIHYQNPRIIAGCLPLWEGKILLCRRAIEPRYGFWTLPAGFMELGETLDQAAIRETREEACAEVESHGLYTVYSLPHVNQVHIFFRAELIDGRFAPGPESLETRLFEETEIPWDELAFSTVRRTLESFLEDKSRDRFEVKVGDLLPSPVMRQNPTPC
ncbi:NUDIX hydrolase [Methylohalobius crimeensis]|uniref:NUDIX hydrolase n=1 Tax=Methylohalobius crimeensis TaxID=244365 RepID=UPI0003B37B5B|nr:NUDIX hydrolase [Methylohalobius crimeensis]